MMWLEDWQIKKIAKILQDGSIIPKDKIEFALKHTKSVDKTLLAMEMDIRLGMDIYSTVIHFMREVKE